MADKLPDTHEIVCKVCGKNKKRIRWKNHRYKRKVTPIWIGEDGLRFNGLICGACHRIRVSISRLNKRRIESEET